MKMYVDPNEIEPSLVCERLISEFHRTFLCAEVSVSLLQA